MATMTKATAYGVKENGGKWTFYPNADSEMDFDLALFQAATMDGCGFCGKVPMDTPFIYNDQMQKGFCNQACYRAMGGVCLCKNEAVYKLYIILVDPAGTLIECIVPVVLCRSCTSQAKANPHFVEGLYKGYCKEAEAKGIEPPHRKDFSIQFRPIEG